MSQNKLLVYLITFISTIALISFSFSPFFQIRNFEYSGLNIVSEEEISNIMHTYLNDNILFLDQRDLNKDLLGHPYIKSVEIIKDYPDQIILNIKEREPIAKINNDGQYLSFTSSGFIVETGSINSRVLVPEIKGLGYSLNNKYISFSPVFNDIVQALKELDIDVRSVIASVSYKDENTITASFRKTPIYLGIPSHLMEKFRVLQSIIIKINEEKLDVGYIDLSLYKKPVIKLNK